MAWYLTPFRSLHPGLVAGHLGELYLVWGKLELAEPLLREALETCQIPLHVMAATRHLGELYEQTGRLDDARALYTHALALAPAIPNDGPALVAEFTAKRAALVPDTAGDLRERGE